MKPFKTLAIAGTLMAVTFLTTVAVDALGSFAGRHHA
jgi:hypothetical protein